MSANYSDEDLDLRRRQITALVTSYYNKYDFLQYDQLNVWIDKALDKFLDTELDIEEINDKLMEEILNRLRDLKERYDDDNIKANHETIYGRLEQLIRALHKEGVDYQLAGALCGYIKYGVESDRCHDDIDINLNEEDIEKFAAICEEMGLVFEDNRMDSPRVLKNNIPSGEHEIIARDPNSNFHIGVFSFERKKDGSVTAKGYYHDENENPCVQERTFAPELAEEIFGDEEIDFRGTPLSITPPEYIYTLKEYTKNEKDQHDLLFLENRIDRDKLMKIRMLSKDGIEVKTGPVDNIKSPVSKQMNDDTKDLGTMLEDQTPNPEVKGTSDKKEDEKVLKIGEKPTVEPTNESSMNEEGAISNLIISTLAFITFVLCFIGVAIIYLVK